MIKQNLWGIKYTQTHAQFYSRWPVNALACQIQTGNVLQIRSNSRLPISILKAAVWHFVTMTTLTVWSAVCEHKNRWGGGVGCGGVGGWGGVGEGGGRGLWFSSGLAEMIVGIKKSIIRSQSLGCWSISP